MLNDISDWILQVILDFFQMLQQVVIYLLFFVSAAASHDVSFIYLLYL